MIGDNFNIPIMYQDLANSTMGPLNMSLGGLPGIGMPGVGMPGGGYVGNSPYLGGVKMRQQPDMDKLIIKNKKENEDKNTFKKALGVIALVIGLASIPPLRKSIKNAGGLVSYMKGKWNGLVKFVKGKCKKIKP